MKLYKYTTMSIVLQLFSIFFSFQAKAVTLVSDTTSMVEVEMADLLRSNGKIYVVVSMLLLIIIGFLLYLAYIDKKIRLLKRKINAKKK